MLLQQFLIKVGKTVSACIILLVFSLDVFEICASPPLSIGRDISGQQYIFSDVAFFKGRLFVKSSLGLIESDLKSVTNLYVWKDGSSLTVNEHSALENILPRRKDLIPLNRIRAQNAFPHAIAKGGPIKYLVEDTLAINNTGLIRTRSGDLLSVTLSGHMKLILLKCEAIGKGVNERLIGVFLNAGVLELTHKWRKIASLPSFTRDDPKQFQIAIDTDGQIALTITATEKRSGLPSQSELWICKGRNFSKIVFSSVVEKTLL